MGGAAQRTTPPFCHQACGPLHMPGQTLPNRRSPPRGRTPPHVSCAHPGAAGALSPRPPAANMPALPPGPAAGRPPLVADRRLTAPVAAAWLAACLANPSEQARRESGTHQPQLIPSHEMDAAPSCDNLANAPDPLVPAAPSAAPRAPCMACAAPAAPGRRGPARRTLLPGGPPHAQLARPQPALSLLWCCFARSQHYSRAAPERTPRQHQLGTCPRPPARLAPAWSPPTGPALHPPPLTPERPLY